MSADVVRLREGSPFLTWYDRRQRAAAALYCAQGHDMERRTSAHLGTWRVCVRCRLIEDPSS